MDLSTHPQLVILQQTLWEYMIWQVMFGNGVIIGIYLMKEIFKYSADLQGKAQEEVLFYAIQIIVMASDFLQDLHHHQKVHCFMLDLDVLKILPTKKIYVY